jgi:hypothetical protein
MSEKKALPQIPSEVLDQLMAGGDMKNVFASGGLFDALKKAMAERILSAEMDHHLDQEASQEQANRRNGVGRKTVLTDTGSMEIEVPRDREGRFDPQLIGKYQRRFPGFDEKIISMYARGMSTRDIQGHLLDIYGLEVSPDLISTVTGGVLEEVSQQCASRVGCIPRLECTILRPHAQPYPYATRWCIPRGECTLRDRACPIIAELFKNGFGDHSVHAKPWFDCLLPIQARQDTLRLRALTRLNWRPSCWVYGAARRARSRPKSPKGLP